jgi:exodeoxyribonuclease VII large subunit
LRNPHKLIDERQLTVDHLSMNMGKIMQLKTTAAKGKFASLVAKLDSLSPLAVLGRGHSMIKDESNKIINSATQLSIGQYLKVNLSDGQADMEVLSIHINEE